MFMGAECDDVTWVEFVVEVVRIPAVGIEHKTPGRKRCSEPLFRCFLLRVWKPGSLISGIRRDCGELCPIG